MFHFWRDPEVRLCAQANFGKISLLLQPPIFPQVAPPMALEVVYLGFFGGVQ